MGRPEEKTLPPALRRALVRLGALGLLVASAGTASLLYLGAAILMPGPRMVPARTHHPVDL